MPLILCIKGIYYAPPVGLRLALLPCISSTYRSFFATLQFTGYHLLNQRSGQQNSRFASFFKLANLFFVSDFALGNFSYHNKAYEPTPVCGCPKVVLRRVTCSNFRPRHDSAPFLLLPPAAEWLEALWLTPLWAVTCARRWFRVRYKI